MNAVDYHWGLPEQFNFTRDVVEQLAEDPNRRALTFVDGEGVIQRLTFSQLAIEAARWANLLRRQGCLPGNRVLVLAGKVPAWLSVMLGAMKAGLITIPCSEMLRARDLAFRAQHSDASLLVADRRTQAEVDAMRGLLDRPLDVLYLDDAALLLATEQMTASTEDTRWHEDAFILYTSGTTREPKGVTHTHGYAFAKRMQAEHWLGARPGDLVWCTAGTGWAKSIWNVLLGPWSRGAEIVMHEGAFDPDERLDLIDRLGVTILCQAPTEYRLLAKLEGLERYGLSRLRHAVSAGEPLNPQVIERFREVFGLTVYDGYGQTENTLLVANTRGVDVRPGSMGLPTPGHDVAVIDEEGREVAPGWEGDVALRGRPPSLFARYWNAPEETAAVFRGEWYVTGDRATRDDNGYFWFAGRADDVILSAAYRIGPFEVESALLEHPAVAESAVVGKPDADRGHIVKAFVVLRAGFEAGDELARELQEHAKQVTAPYKYPREIEFVSTLPKTRSGKIRRTELRELEERRAQDGRPSVAVTQPVARAAPAVQETREAERPAQDETKARPEAEKQRRREEERERKKAEDARRRAELERRQREEEERRDREEAERRARSEARELERRQKQEEKERRKREEEEQRAREAQERAARESAERAEQVEALRQARAAAEEEQESMHPSLVERLQAYRLRPSPTEEDAPAAPDADEAES